MTEKTAILLINLGTPDAPTTKAVRKFLKEFLSDPRVIDLPALVRWILVNIFILPFRPKQSAEAYASVWQTTGSPLLLNSRQLQQALQNKLGLNYTVALAMRYGNPSIKSVLDQLQAQTVTRLIVVPLFPQYSSAATGSVIEKVLSILKSYKNFPAIEIRNDFFNDPHFIAAYAEIIREQIKDKNIEKLIFSYHGLPVRQIKNDPDRFNYQKQCFTTSELIAAQLSLSTEQYVTTFQSRLGRTEWIKPYTDVVLPELAQQGIKRIAIVCPSFVSDCLETIEEIGMRAKEQWHELGGELFITIPCLNNNERWVDALKEICIVNSKSI